MTDKVDFHIESTLANELYGRTLAQSYRETTLIQYQSQCHRNDWLEKICLCRCVTAIGAHFVMYCVCKCDLQASRQQGVSVFPQRKPKQGFGLCTFNLSSELQQTVI